MQISYSSVTFQAPGQDVDRRTTGAETATVLFWALLVLGQFAMRKVDGWQSLEEKPSDQIIDLAALSDNLVTLEMA
jgi:hypothetical protein